MNILLDMDGVFVDFYRGALEIHNIHTPRDEFCRQHPGEFDIVKMLGMTLPAFWKPMNEEFWAKLEWMEDGPQILELVEERCGQENIILWSAPCPNYGCYDGKKRWIERHLHRHYKHHFVCGHHKYIGASTKRLLIDDFDSNIEPFQEDGGSTILVPRIWNSNFPLAERTLEYLEDRLFNSTLLDKI